MKILKQITETRVSNQKLWNKLDELVGWDEYDIGTDERVYALAKSLECNPGEAGRIITQISENDYKVALLLKALVRANS